MRWMRLSATFVDIVVMTVAFCLCVIAVEVALRLIDGYRLDRLILQAKNADPVLASSGDLDATQYAKKITLDPTFDLAWFHTDPPDYDRSPNYELPADWAEAVRDYRPSSPDEPYYIKEGLKFLYNYNSLVEVCAAGNYIKGLEYYKKNPGFVYAFASPDASDLPPYRTVPRGWARGTDYYNNFGFRGPDIVPRKSERLIRVAFLDSSVAAAGWPFSFPEYVVHYLRQWARANKLDVDFDLVNAARVGVNMAIIAQIMRYEVAPLHPDIVVSYDGGEYLWGAPIVKRADGESVPAKTGLAVDVRYHPLEQYSALLSRLYQFSGSATGMENSEAGAHVELRSNAEESRYRSRGPALRPSRTDRFHSGRRERDPERRRRVLSDLIRRHGRRPTSPRSRPPQSASGYSQRPILSNDISRDPAKLGF